MAEIKLVSSDAKEFKVPMDIARKSVTLNTMLQDLGLEDGKEDFRFRFTIFSLVKLTYFLIILYIFS